MTVRLTSLQAPVFELSLLLIYDGSLETGEDVAGVLAAAAGMVVEHHAGRRWAAPAPVIAEGRLADACSDAVMDAIVPGLQIGEGQVDKH